MTNRHDSPGDLGRRIAYRRRQLGLTREQVASRTGMAPEYLDYVERYHAQMAAETLLNLAVALETTVDALLGATTDRPPGPVPEPDTSRSSGGSRPVSACGCWPPAA